MLTLILLLVSSDPLVASPQSSCAQEVASIQAYSKRIDKLIKKAENRSSKRTFARQSSDARDQAGQWIEVETLPEDSRFENASVWTIEGNTIAAQIVVQNPSAEWVHRLMYYFREDGTLARISATFDSAHGARIVVREQFFDKKGVLLSQSSQQYTLRAKSQPGRIAVDEPIPVFPRVNELPFYRAMERHVAPSQSR